MIDGELFPDWFMNLSRFDENERTVLKDSTVSDIESSCPSTVKFIKDFKCELVGFCPRIEFKEIGEESKEVLFDGPTLLYWCKSGKFGFVVGCEQSEFEQGRKPKPAPIDDRILWFEQMAHFDEAKLKEIQEKALNLIKKAKSETYYFIKKYGCEPLGFIPQVEYTMITDEQNDINTTWVHPFSIPTLLFWCRQGKFIFFVNANLDHNESVLEKVPGNKLTPLRGFTG